MNWRALLDLAGISHGHWTADFTLADFNNALRDGSAYKWRGMGRKKYRLLCIIMDYPEPVFDGNMLVKSPDDILRERTWSGFVREHQIR